jgi:hypothetical protein
MKQMYIQKRELEEALAIVNEFPDAYYYELQQDNSSGIGSTLSLAVSTTVNDRPATIKSDFQYKVI